MPDTTIKDIRTTALSQSGVPFPLRVVFIHTPNGWKPLRGCLQCPKEHRQWVYNSGVIDRLIDTI